MTKFDVYGMGNGLVDTVYRVDQTFFEKNRIEKGVMELINEERYRSISQKLGPFIVERSGGGSVANSMIAISQLGGKGFYSFKVADDNDGHFYREDMTAANLKFNNKTLEKGTTGRCMVMVTPDADRTMNTFLGITEQFSSNELDIEALKNSNYLYIEGYLMPSPTALEAVIKASRIAKLTGVNRALSFSDPNMVKFFRKNLDLVIDGGIDLLFCNLDEASCYTNCSELTQIVQKLKIVAQKFVITLGSKGALVYDGTNVVEVAAKKVNAIDTVGAGDMFAGVFLHGITSGKSFVDSAMKGCMAAGEVVSRYGARVETEILKKAVEL